MAAVTICSDFGAQENKVCHCFHCFSIYLPWSDGTRCHDLSFLNVKLLFHSPLSLSSRGSFSFSSLSATRVVSSAYLRLLLFLPAVLISACASSSLAFHLMYSACKLNKQMTIYSLDYTSQWLLNIDHPRNIRPLRSDHCKELVLHGQSSQNTLENAHHFLQPLQWVLLMRREKEGWESNVKNQGCYWDVPKHYFFSQKEGLTLRPAKMCGVNNATVLSSMTCV